MNVMWTTIVITALIVVPLGLLFMWGGKLANKKSSKPKHEAGCPVHQGQSELGYEDEEEIDDDDNYPNTTAAIVAAIS